MGAHERRFDAACTPAGRCGRGFFRLAYQDGQERIRPDDLGWLADHLWPQTAFLPDCNPSRLFGVARATADPLSFIGSVGRIDEDFARLAELLDLLAARLPRHNARATGRAPASAEAPESRAVRSSWSRFLSSPVSFRTVLDRGSSGFRVSRARKRYVLDIINPCNDMLKA